jgi:ribosome-associated protein
MRRQDDEALDAIRDAMSKDGDAARRETAAMHRIEALRDALLGDDGDAAMTELLDEHPQADRQKLRQLVRNAHEERKRNKPPRAFRELFRELRELHAHGEDTSDDAAEDLFDDEGDEDHG